MRVNAKTDGGKRPCAVMIWESSAKGVSMKLVRKLLGITAIITAVGFIVINLTGCLAESDDGGSGTTIVPDGGGVNTGNKTHITVADISITAPAKGAAPATAVFSQEQERFTAGTVTWSPNDNPFKGGAVYTAKVTLTAKSGYTFTGLIETNAKINGDPTVLTNNIGETVTLSHTFAATSDKEVSSIAIKSPPSNLTYTHGDKFELDGLTVTLTYDNGSTEDVAAINFSDKNITTDPGHGIPIERKTYNGKPIEITYGNLKVETTGKLTINAKSISDLFVDVTAKTYTGSPITLNENENEKEIIVKHSVVTGTTRELKLGIDYTVASYSNNTNAGTATVTINGIEDYTDSKTVVFTINKAAGVAVNAPTLNDTYPDGHFTINDVTASNGQSVEYGISIENNAATVSGWRDELYFSVITGLDYYIFARSKENGNYLTGSASASLSVVFPRTKIVEFADLLDLPNNTADNAYKIKMNVSEFGGFYGLDYVSVATFLKKNDDKFISLDLSESTFTSITGNGGTYFQDIKNLVSIILPNSVTSIGNNAFQNCTSLTSVTFATGSNIPDANFGNNVFPEGSTGAGGNTLKTAYNNATTKAGTYTRSANGSTWSKQ